MIYIVSSKFGTKLVGINHPINHSERLGQGIENSPTGY